MNVFFGLGIVLLTIFLLYKMRKCKPRVAGYGSQRICPFCGLITSRLRACCLECGKSLTTVSVTPILEKYVVKAYYKAHMASHPGATECDLCKQTELALGEREDDLRDCRSCPSAMLA